MSDDDHNPLRRIFSRHRRRRGQLEPEPRSSTRARARPPFEDLGSHEPRFAGASAWPRSERPVQALSPAEHLEVADRPSLADARAIGWDVEARRPDHHPASGASLASRILSLLAEPGVHGITAARAAQVLAVPRQDVVNTLDALRCAGELASDGPNTGPTTRYFVPPARKHELEAMYRAAAYELGESRALVRGHAEDLVTVEEEEEPRLPITAGLLSVFLPGTGQLLNGDVGRASLVFAVWSLALLTNLPPIWTFVCLYAGAEAFFTAKVRGMERRRALAAATGDEHAKATTP